MPIVPFASLPDSSRVWVFACDRPVVGAAADTLLAGVDRYLTEWKAHGMPLYCARDWREDRFLAIGVDTTREHASGCSIDGMFRELRGVEEEIGTKMLGGGRVFYREPTGAVQTIARDEVSDAVARGRLTERTPVFDTALTSADAWRTRFEQPAEETWAAPLLNQGSPKVRG